MRPTRRPGYRDEPLVQIAVTMPRSVQQQLRLQAIRQGTTVMDIVADAVRDKLRKVHRRPRV